MNKLNQLWIVIWNRVEDNKTYQLFRYKWLPMLWQYLKATIKLSLDTTVVFFTLHLFRVFPEMTVLLYFESMALMFLLENIYEKLRTLVLKKQ